jgi:hypothetical protein
MNAGGVSIPQTGQGQPRRDMRSSLFVRSLPPRDALASSHDGYDDRDPVKAAVPAALDGRSEIMSHCRVPDAGLQTEEFSGRTWDRTRDLSRVKRALSR